MALKWQGYSTNEFEAYGEVIFHSISCLGILILIFIYINVYCCTKNKKTTSNIHTKKETKTYMFLLGSLVFSFIYIFGTYSFNVILTIILGQRSVYGCFMRMCWVFALALQRITVYAFFLIRLYETFKESVFNIGKRSIIIIVIILLITLSSGAIAAVIFSYLADNFLCEKGKYFNEWYLSGLISSLMDVGWCIILSLMFIRKLSQLINMIKTTIKRDDNRVTKVVYKLSTLAFVTVISTLINGLLAFLLRIWSHQFASIDLVINNICIMLSFAKFNNSYKRYCCCCIRIQYLCCIQPNKDENIVKTGIEMNSIEEVTTTTSI